MALILQHPSAAVVFAPPAAYVERASEPGIAAPKLWVCSTCRISLVMRARPMCFQCGQPMRVGKK